ncbi:MAG: ABC transporter permease [Thermoleophilia bacterium]
MEALRNLRRRKLRAALTVFGIAIGIFAFTVMGSMAEKINQLVGGALDFWGEAINVEPEAGGGFGGMIPLTALEEVRELPGVQSVHPSVVSFFGEPGEQGFSFGAPNLIFGNELTEDWLRRSEQQGLNVVEGRFLEPGDRGAMVVGADLAREKELEVGEQVSVRGHEFEIVGILERSLQFTDSFAFTSIEDTQEMLAEQIPVLRTQEVATGAQVFLEPGADAEALARQIDDLPQLRAQSPQELRSQIESGTVIFNLIIFGVALIAIVVGGLSVINTMIMSVTERTREIGIKRAVGARTRHILAEYIGEAALIGFLGGLVGFFAGWALTLFINQWTESSGTILFTMTPRLAGGALGFSLVLGAVAGVYPALRAARMNPVQALRTM